MAWFVDQYGIEAKKILKHALKTVGMEEEQELRLVPPVDPKMGDLGLACHPFARILRRSPKQIAEEVSQHMVLTPYFSEVQAINGYVNLRFCNRYLFEAGVRQVEQSGDRFWFHDNHRGERVLIEFSGPNTNKPQHLGHVRTNVLGLACSNLLKAVGYDVVRANIINDRGIHICKSMLAYERFGSGKTPESEGRKGDFFVGDYYVLFDQKLREEYAAHCAKFPEQKISKDDFAKEHSQLQADAQNILRAWEREDKPTRALWAQMNEWVYQGFAETYARMGISFDWVDYESETYLLGRHVVEQGLEQGKFSKRDDGAVVFDLTQMGKKEGQKVLLRSDGTSVYMTQDLGTATRRFEKHQPEKMIYVVADEQNYHFEVLFGILQALQVGYGERCHHLSYGMVELPHGRMKSREGTVVDADHLMDELRELSLSKVKEYDAALSAEDALERAEKIGQAGLKFFILHFTPQTRILFNPEKSIDFKGETGPYCLYLYARINSIFEKIGALQEYTFEEKMQALGTEHEIALAKILIQYPQVVREAAEQLNPARLTKYLFHLGQAFSTLYNAPGHRIKDMESPRKEGCLQLIQATQKVMKSGLALIGIDTVDHM
ncbi:MAG: arginine--tRNA ligase [Myxococcota bacterium]